MTVYTPRLVWSFGAAVLVCTGLGCARSAFRKSADRDAYGVIAQKESALAPESLPENRSIDPGPDARFFDGFDPDHPPMPPDDALSHEAMEKVDGMKGAREWRKKANPAAVAGDELWRHYLPRNKAGEVVLDLASAVRVGISNSRDFQTEREDLYFSALDVTYERFRFSPRLALGSGGAGTTNGVLQGGRSVLRATQQSPVLSDGSVRWMSASGGELLARFGNALVWDFNGDSVTHKGASLLNFSVLQPLMRLGGRARTLEALTQSERTLLANVRQMEQFQEGFYVRVVSGRNSGEGPSRSDVVGANGLGLIAGNPAGRTGAPRADGFLGMLEEQQRNRNLESNVARLRQSLDQLEAAFDAGRISSRLQVDQARQALFNGQSSLLTSRALYQTKLDSFKVDLGLPPDLAVVVKDPLLDRFNSTNPVATELSRKLEFIQTEIRDKERLTSADQLSRKTAALFALEKPSLGLLKSAQGDLAALRTIIPLRSRQLERLRDRPDLADLSIEPSRVDGAFLEKRVKLLAERLDRVGTELKAMFESLRTFETERAGLEFEAARSRLSEWAGDLSGVLLALALDQTAARLESAVLPSIDLEETEALAIARENRLDWMNARARLVDAWRRIGFYANPLMSGLDLSVTGGMGTLRNDATRFDARTGNLSAGLRFDTPLDRLGERNDYRGALIDYQRARRDFMLFEDRVSLSLRNTLRIVKLSEFNFELRRSAVQVAIAQVDLARLRLDEPPRLGAQAQFGATTARDLVSALSDLLDAQNDFLSLQVGYEVLRLVLDFELGTLHLNPEGLWLDPGPMSAASIQARAPKWQEVEKLKQTAVSRLNTATLKP